MINLLNTETQRQYRAARLNIRLRSYLILLSVAFISVIAVFGGGLYLTLTDRSHAAAEKSAKESQLAQYHDIKQEAETFTTNLKTAKAILNQEVLYSDMIVSIANALPPDAVLSSLTLDTTTIAQPMALSARVATKDDSIRLKTSLETSPLFENVNINNIIVETISNTETSVIKRELPVVVTISVTATRGQEGGLIR